jgi:hypothetical protein
MCAATRGAASVVLASLIGVCLYDNSSSACHSSSVSS